MQITLYVLLCTLYSGILSAAAQNPYETICAVNPGHAKLSAMENEISEKKELYLNMEFGTGEFVFKRIILKENSLFIDGECILDKISLFVSGGSPANTSTKEGILTYRNPMRFFTANARYTHYRKLTAMMKKFSDEELLTHELKELEFLQKQTSLAGAVALVHTKSPTLATLVIDLAAWLTYCHGPDWRTILPVKRILTKPLAFPLSWMWTVAPFTDLTQPELDAAATASN